MATIISFSNHKGGTGKTTSVINIACALRNKKKNVLVIDLDPQSNLSYSLGVGKAKFTVIDVLTNLVSAENSLIATNGIFLLPSSIAIYQHEEAIKNIANYNSILKNKIKNLAFDFILIDCPPSISTFTQIGLNASDYVIIPMLLEILSIQGLNQILQYTQQIKSATNPNLEILGVLGVCVNESRRLTNEVLEFIDNQFDVDVFNNRVHSNVKAAEAPSFAKSVIDYAPESVSARDYKCVTDEILKRIKLSQEVQKNINK